MLKLTLELQAEITVSCAGDEPLFELRYKLGGTAIRLFAPGEGSVFFISKNEYSKAMTGLSRYIRCFKESRDGGSLQIPVSKLTLKLQAEHQVSPAGIMPLI